MVNDKAVKILIPTHIQKSNWLIAFLESLRNSVATDVTVDIVLVITSVGEYEYYSRIIHKYATENLNISIFSVREFLLSSYELISLLDHLDQGALGGIVVFKKFAALYWLATTTDADAICVDADTLAVNIDERFFDLLRFNANSKITFGNLISADQHIQYYQINTASANMLGQNVRSFITEKSIDLIYNWFMDAPFYQNVELKQFFEHVFAVHGGSASFFLGLRWNTFEYIMYQYFLAYNEKLNFLSTNSIGITCIPEELTMRDLFIIERAFRYRPVWVRARRYLEFSGQFVAQQRPSLLYHFDRF
jgi:hypothetical protein